MAKPKQRLNRRKLPVGRVSEHAREADEGASQGSAMPGTGASEPPRWALLCRRLAAALLGGLVVYVAYFPSDSVLVEAGDALWFSAISLLVWTMTMATEPMFRGPRGNGRSSVANLWGDGLAMDLLVGCLAVWMVLAALVTCPPGNLRQATNESWFWVAGAAVLSAGRRLLSDRASRSMALSLLAAVATGMAIHAIHQDWISLPRTRAEYLADPDEVLRAAGIDAPRNSARRMVFANRLLDGGPTATFALANSLAAVLMVAVLVPVGFLRSWRHRQRPRWVLVGLAVLLFVGALALFSTRSRSALIACALGVAWICLPRSPSTASGSTDQGCTVKPVTSGPVSWLVGTMVAIGIGGVVFVGLLLFGNEEWISAAPSSLEFRLQYWKSTLALVADHPLMGAGPGGFQSMYLRYRLPVANETIADPHNFFFETLAAGGVIAGLLLTLLIAVSFRDGRKSSRVDDIQDSANADRDPSSMAAWIGYGAGASLSVVWLFASFSGRFPDFEAAIFAIPIAVAAGWFLHSEFVQAGVTGTGQSETRLICSAILIAVMTHLMFSGGWTVPGVAIVVWLVVGSLCCTESVWSNPSVRPATALNESVERARRLATRAGLAVFVIGLALVFCLRFESIVPVQEAQLALSSAEDAARVGSPAEVDLESFRATQADRWSFEAPRWRSEYLKGRLVAGGDDLVIRESWAESLQTAIDRAGDNPLLWRASAEQFLHLYQRYGRVDDLQEADRLISRALDGNPTDVSLTAQAALIAIELSEREKAEVLAAEATRISELGGNIVRDLGLQQVYVVENMGAAAAGRPIQQSIKDQFRRRLRRDHEPVDLPQRSIETDKSVKLDE